VWGEFVYAVTFLNDSSLFPISVIILQQIGNDQTAWNSLLAMSTITMAPVLVLLLLAQGRIREGLTVGALK
jgi:ABC-type glycerol-3-phosphate transport system permease component